jgi:hypothetical protein
MLRGIRTCLEKPGRQSRNFEEKPEFRKTPERRIVGGPGKYRNTEELELPTRAETSEVPLEWKIPRNLDIRKKESRRPMQNRRPDRMSGE